MTPFLRKLKLRSRIVMSYFLDLLLIFTTYFGYPTRDVKHVSESTEIHNSDMSHTFCDEQMLTYYLFLLLKPEFVSAFQSLTTLTILVTKSSVSF